MSQRNIEREKLRQERLAAQKAAQASDKRRLYLAYAGAGVIGVLVVVGLVMVLIGAGNNPDQIDGKDVPDAAHVQISAGSVNGYAFDDRTGTPPEEIEAGILEEAAKAADCELGLDLPDEGNTHFGPKADTPKYKTNPATSGNHIEPNFQQADGAYSEFPDEKYTVHSLEHGRVALQYSPDLSENEQLELKGVFDASPHGMLFYPNPQMPFEAAATAWTQMIGCKEYQGQATLDALQVFRDSFRGQGPENVPIVLPN